MHLTEAQMRADIAFLAKRCHNAGAFSCGGERDWGISSNSLVAMAYRVGRQQMPGDWHDYAACVRAVRHLPRHRRTPRILEALAKARRCVQRKYPRRDHSQEAA